MTVGVGLLLAAVPTKLLSDIAVPNREEGHFESIESARAYLSLLAQVVADTLAEIWRDIDA
jgi:hypothetical protein